MVILNMNRSGEKWHVSIYVIFFYLFSQCFCEDPKNDCDIEIPNMSETLTPYLVNKTKCGLISFSGFLNGKDNSKMFFWYFPSKSNELKDPIVVWFQGDLKPSIEGLFENNGPIYAKTKGVKLRKHFWSQKVNMLYLDTVIGSGFSHTGSSKIYPTDMNDLVNNLHESLVYFLGKFTHLKRNDFYLAGDGFACQIITNLAKLVDGTEGEGSTTINLKGLIIENGICDPTFSVVLASHYYNLGIIDSWNRDIMIREERKIQGLIRSKKFTEAFDAYDEYIKGFLTPYKTMFNNKTFYETTHNLLHTKNYWTSSKYATYIQNPNIKHDIHVSSSYLFHDDINVFQKLKGEFMKSSSTNLENLLNKYRVLMYYGQMNPEISPVAGFSTVSSLKWCGSSLINDIRQQPLFLNNNRVLYGYVVNVKPKNCFSSLVWAMVNNAGQKIANDKPEEVLDLINKFIKKSF